MTTIQAWQLLLVTLAGWINRHQQDVIEYIQEENRILRKELKEKRIRFTDDERRRLAIKGKTLGRSVLNRAIHANILDFHARVLATRAV